VDVYRYEKGLQNIDQPKNAEGKSSRRASLLIITCLAVIFQIATLNILTSI